MRVGGYERGAAGALAVAEELTVTFCIMDGANCSDTDVLGFISNNGIALAFLNSGNGCRSDEAGRANARSMSKGFWTLALGLGCLGAWRGFVVCLSYFSTPNSQQKRLEQ